MKIKLPTCPECGSVLERIDENKLDDERVAEFRCGTEYAERGDEWVRIYRSGACEDYAKSKDARARISYDANGGVHTT